MLTCRSLLASLLALALAPASALGSSVQVTGGVMVFTAEPGEINDVRLGAAPTGRSSRAVIEDLGSDIALGSGCTAVEYAEALCAGVDSIEVALDDGDDHYADSESLRQRPKVDGGEGDDFLESRAGVPGRLLAGGPGDDRLEAVGAQADPVVMLGSSGDDSLAVRSHAPSRQYGGKGDDTLKGNRSTDLLSGAAGIDNLSPGSGTDRVASGRGRDRVSLRDGAADTLDCGSSRDRVRFDARLDTLTGCA